jgi:hypothetical protein
VAGLWSNPGDATRDDVPAGKIVDTGDPRQWAARPLVSASQINFQTNGTYYISAGINHQADGCCGVGFSSGTNASSAFVGFGFTWNNYGFESTDVGNSLYISTGTLGQPDPTYVQYPEAGPLVVRAYGTNSAGTMVGDSLGRGLVIARLDTTTSGNSTLRVAHIPSGGTVPSTEADLVWDVTYNFTETSTLNHFLIWDYVNNQGWPYNEIDGLRVGTAYPDVAGLEFFTLTASPSATNFAATPVTITCQTGSTGDAASYQWQKDGVNLTDDGNISGSSGTQPGVGRQSTSLSLLNSVSSDSGNYALVLSNNFGMATSAVVHVTINPASAPVVDADPKSATRYVGGRITFTPVVSGTPPYTYQWKHGATTLTDQTNLSLVLTDITTADAGSYSIHIANVFGSADSGAATLTVQTPPSCYVASALALKPLAFWPLDETGSAVIHDYVGGLDGVADTTTGDGVNTTNVLQGVAGPRNLPFLGFASDTKRILPPSKQKKSQ